MSDTDARREAFITRQLAALRDLGLPPALLAREEALLRGGLAEASLALSSLHLPPEEGLEQERSGETEQPEPACAAEEEGAGEREEAQSDAGSDDSDWEPLHASSAHATHPAPAPSDQPPPAAVQAKLRWLVEKAEHRCFELSGVWKEAGLSQTLLQLLQTSSALEDAAAVAAVQSACAAAFAERWCAEARARAQVDETLPAVLQALQGEAGLSLWALGRLCSAAGGGGGWEEGAEDVAGPAAAAAVWPHVHACLDVVVAPQAERLASAASTLRRALDRGGAQTPSHGAELDAAASLGRLIAFYATHAPGGADAGEQLLRCGALRSAAAALSSSPTPLPALRRGVLLVAAASAPACAFVAAVPGCAAALGAEGCAEGGVWPLIRDGGTGEATRLIEALQPESAALPETLSLLREAMRCAGSGRRLWRTGDAVHAALLRLQAWLRAQGGVASGEEGVGAAGKAAERSAALRATLKGVLGESGKAD